MTPEYRIGDKVTVTWPTENNADDVDLDVHYPEESGYEDVPIEGTIRSLYDYNVAGETWLYTVNFDSVSIPSWTCRAKWFAPQSGPW